MIDELSGAAGVAVVVALVEVIKRAWPEMPARLVALLPLLVGVLVNLAVMRWSLASPYEATLMGTIVGLMAAGAYSGVKKAVKG